MWRQFWANHNHSSPNSMQLHMQLTFRSSIQLYPFQWSLSPTNCWFKILKIAHIWKKVLLCSASSKFWLQRRNHSGCLVQGVQLIKFNYYFNYIKFVNLCPRSKSRSRSRSRSRSSSTSDSDKEGTGNKQHQMSALFKQLNIKTQSINSNCKPGPSIRGQVTNFKTERLLVAGDTGDTAAANSDEKVDLASWQCGVKQCT